MFGRDVYTPTLANLPQPKLINLSNTSILFSLEMLREVDMLEPVNLKKASDMQLNKVTRKIPNL